MKIRPIGDTLFRAGGQPNRRNTLQK